MTTDELINALRKWGEAFADKVDKLHFLLMQAADRLEELKPQESPCVNCQEWVCEGCKYAEHGEAKE